MFSEKLFFISISTFIYLLLTFLLLYLCGLRQKVAKNASTLTLYIRVSIKYCLIPYKFYKNRSYPIQMLKIKKEV